MSKISKEFQPLGSNHDFQPGSEGKTIPLRKPFLDDPLSFLHYATKRKHAALQRMDNYRIFLWDMPDRWDDLDPNYASFPKNAWHDASNTLILYAEFGQPTLDKDNRAEGLAICGFNERDCLAEKLESGGLGQVDDRTLDIAQFQTTRFPDEREMFHYIGFLKYKELFMHVLEQLAWRMKNVNGSPINYVSIEESMRGDQDRAVRLAGEDSQILAMFPLYPELNQIRQQREKWVGDRGYNRQIMARGARSFAKPVGDIIPDNSLQAHLGQLIIG